MLLRDDNKHRIHVNGKIHVTWSTIFVFMWVVNHNTLYISLSSFGYMSIPYRLILRINIPPINILPSHFLSDN